MNKTNLQYAVKYIVKNEKGIDLIVYFGYLSFRPLNLYKIPEKFKPKNTYVAGKILLSDVVDDRIFNYRVRGAVICDTASICCRFVVSDCAVDNIRTG